LSGLQDRPDKPFLVPGQKRLAGEVGADRQVPAVELAALDAEADLAATGITGEGLQQGLLCQVYFHSKYIR
jgi:hypothetical protein